MLRAGAGRLRRVRSIHAKFVQQPQCAGQVHPQLAVFALPEALLNPSLSHPYLVTVRSPRMLLEPKSSTVLRRTVEDFPAGLLQFSSKDLVQTSQVANESQRPLARRVRQSSTGVEMEHTMFKLIQQYRARRDGRLAVSAPCIWGPTVRWHVGRLARGLRVGRHLRRPLARDLGRYRRTWLERHRGQSG